MHAFTIGIQHHQIPKHVFHGHQHLLPSSQTSTGKSMVGANQHVHLFLEGKGFRHPTRTSVWVGLPKSESIMEISDPGDFWA